MTTSCTLFVTCLPGLEGLLRDELGGLGAARPTVAAGGVECDGDLRLLHRAVLETGLAGHVLLRLDTFRCRALGELERKSARLPWTDWVRPDRPLALRARARRSRLHHTGAIAERVHRGIAAALGAAPPAAADNGPVPTVRIRFLDDHCTLSLDVTGHPLHRRGYRLATSAAPLREDLARALVVASGWDGRSPLLDPFCGSGTVLIEAAIRARRLAPGRDRPHALFDSARFDEDLWQELRAAADARAIPEGELGAPIRGSDRADAAVAAAADNAARAGVAGDLELCTAGAGDAPWLSGDPAPPARGWLATNPPYGVRLRARRGLVPLYQSVGHRLRTVLGRGWSCALMAHDRRLARRLGVPLRTAFHVDHGGLKVTALVHDAEPLS